MGRLIELTALPEWSEFFRALTANGCLRVRWREEGGGWTAQVYEFTRDLGRPLVEEDVGPKVEGAEKFEVLRLAIDRCGRKISPKVWDAFYQFRGAANGTADNIEDLL